MSELKTTVTGLERIVAALNFEKLDRVPAAPLFCGASHRVLGTTYDKWSTDADIAAKSFLAAQELLDFDIFNISTDLSVEAADFGQEVIFPLTNTAHVNPDNQLIKGPNDYDKIKYFSPLKGKRMKYVLDIISQISKEKGNETAIFGYLYGPLGILAQIRGCDQLFKDMLKHPNEVLKTIEIITTVLVEYAVAQVKAGANAVGIITLFSSSTILSKKMWEKNEGAFIGRIAEAIREAGGIVTIHNCGNGAYFDEIIHYTKPAAISVAHPAFGCNSWEDHAKKWGKKVVTMGYSDPAKTGLMMSRNEILRDCKKQMEIFKKYDGNFILSTGCEFPPNGNLLSAKAMIDASKMFGNY